MVQIQMSLKPNDEFFKSNNSFVDLDFFYEF